MQGRSLQVPNQPPPEQQQQQQQQQQHARAQEANHLERYLHFLGDDNADNANNAQEQEQAHNQVQEQPVPDVGRHIQMPVGPRERVPQLVSIVVDVAEVLGNDN